MKKDKKQTGLIITVKAFSLIVAGAFLLSSCSTDTSNYARLGLKESSEHVSDAPAPVEDLFENEKLIFNEFIHQILNATSLRYTRSLSSAQPITPASANFTRPQIATIYEQRRDGSSVFVVETQNPNGYTQRINHNGSTPSWSNIEAKELAFIDVYPSDFQDNLFELCRTEAVTLLSVSYEPLDGTDYLCFNVSELNGLASWYFNNNQLFMRKYPENGATVTVQYQNITLNDVDPEIFNLSEYINLEAVPETAYDSAATSADTSENPKYDSSSSASSSVDSSASSESSLASSSKPESSASVKTPDPSAPVSMPSSETPSSAAASSASTSAPSSIPPASSESSKTPSKVIVNPVDPETPSVPSEYPSDVLPLPYFFNLVDSKVQSRGGVKYISLYGNVAGPSESVVSFFDDILKDTSTYSKNEFFDEENGYTYFTVKGRLSGWNTRVEVSTSHKTNKTTCSISVER